MITAPSAVPRTSRARRRLGRAATAAVIALLATACGSGGGSGPEAGATVDRDATLRVAYAGPMASLDPANDPTGSSQPATYLLYDRLTQMGNDLTVEPMLATSWQFGPDGSYLEMTLREGVAFHDGTAVDAGAVKATIERNKSLQGSTVAPVLASIASVTVVGPLTVRFDLVPGQGAELPAVFTTNAGEILSPKALTDGRDLGLAPGDAGSGPYVVSEFTPGEGVTLTRAPQPYWDPEAGKVASIEFSYNAQGSVRLNALRAGQIDLAQITGADMRTGRQLSESGAFSISMAPILTPYMLYINSNEAPFDDVRVRQAVTRAIDRTAISDQLLDGTCEPRVQPYPKGYWPHADVLDSQVAAAPAQAEALLTEANAGTVSFQLTFTAGSSFEPIAQVIQSQLAAVGVTVELMPLPSAEAYANARQGQYQAFLGSAPSDVDPAQLMQSVFLAGYDAGEAVRDTIAPLADTGDDPSLTQQQRAEVYRQIWTVVAQEASVIPICASSQEWAFSPKVTGIADMTGRWSGYPDLRYVAVTG